MSFSNTYDTSNPGSAVSNREDLTDVLTILAPEETPILSSASKQKASATDTEWTVDVLDDPNTDGIIEGEDVATYTDQFAGRARMGNFTQKFRRDYKVSELQEAVDSVGPAKIAQAEAKAIRELKRDVEKTLCSDNVKQQAAALTPYKMNGLAAYISSSPEAGVGVPSGFETPASSVYTIAEDTANSFSETIFNDLISSVYEVNGTVNSLTLVANTGLRRTVSDFARLAPSGETSIRDVNYEGGSAQIKLSVELYQSDHGIVSIVNGNPVCMPKFGESNNKGAGFLVNPEYYGIHELIPMGTSRLPNLGGGERGIVDCALTLGVYHPQAHGLIKGQADA
ncbi:DUF5309 family protein [Brevundimonas sp.]|jgi:hypothetical protein|uniref:SU10 major capsid protein n=1 Tax=Brevundimonas sp. TaxID=1871086 RepID=UPI00257D3A3B|nr:DUF5309 family protein [Brevundimonas sp.]|tara:strand:- start:1500 stop:2516 length:1017 start_codon:yes stop_codon:yes gene_type:complete